MNIIFSLALRTLYFVCLIGGLSVHTFAADNNTLVGSTVTTRQGLVRGTTQDSVCVWRGIPYAKQPVGDLRFRAPQAPESWSGIKEATVFTHVAPQTRRATKETIKQGEDCLSLNVWSPAADGKKRPVMVWLHGGGFLVGSGGSPLYDGINLAKNGDVVVVTINYRLGALGFLYFDEIKGNKSGFDNNLGIRDQVAALQWVKENIAAFGGDPDMVTIFGESAGAVSVLTLLNVPSAKGLFKRAIVESGSPEFLWQPKTATELTVRYMKMLGISPDHIEDLKTVNKDTLVFVMDRLISQLMHEPTTVKILWPTIDGIFIPGDLMSAIAAGRAAGVDVMIGTNKDEATLLALKRIGITPKNAEGLAPYLANIDSSARRQLTSTYKNYPHKRGVMDMTTDGIFVMPSIKFSEVQTTYASTYMYRFDWSSPLLKMVGLRACHGLELPFVFGTLDKGPGKLFAIGASKKTIRRISQQMQQSWINFARYGNPNGSSPAVWEKYNSTNRYTMIFDKKSYVSNDPSDFHRKAWGNLSIFK
jgi:para-nitrobenzyl esterase